MYRALYRKYRPLAFEDVVGQEHIVETIKNQIINNKISHAYMFTGTRGTGKTTCAKILARAVNCENPKNGNPCNECSTCKSILNGSLMDVYEIDAASNNGVDNIRELREDVIFTPALAKYKVYIIDEVHMLSTQAFNALLKTLEEPPEHIIFVFATTEINKVPQTILSRCQRFDFRRITVGDIEKRIKYVAECENIKIDDAAVSLIARLADGALRDALSVLDRCSNGNSAVTLSTVEQTVGICSYDEIARALCAAADSDTAAILDFYAECRRKSKDSVSLFSELCSYFRDMIVVKLVNDSGAFLSYDDERIEGIKSLAERFSLEKIVRSVSILQNGIYDISRYKDKHIMAELALIKLTSPQLGGDYDDLNARLSALEQSGAVPAAIPSRPKPEKPSKSAEKKEAPPVFESLPSDKSVDLFIKTLSDNGGKSITPFLTKDIISIKNNVIYIVCSKNDFAYSVLSSAESVELMEKAAASALKGEYKIRFAETPIVNKSEAPSDGDLLGELLNSAEDILYKE